MSTKKQNKRIARKAGTKWVSDVKRDSMSAARRGYGAGKAK